MNRILLSLLMLAVFIAGSNARFFYLSPGLRFSWDFRGHAAVSPKISLGTVTDFGFNNITIGAKQPMGKVKKTEIMPSYYIEYQAGTLAELDLCVSDYSDEDINEHPTVYGGSIGFVFHRGKERMYIGPKVSAFAGFIAFGIIDTDYTKETGFNTDLGCQLALPFLWFSLP